VLEQLLFRLADNGDPASIASSFRKARVRKFGELLQGASGELRILDVGGTSAFWQRYRDELPTQVTVTVLNKSFQERPQAPWISYVYGDAREMHMFGDRDFDMCFSNSVIEHVGTSDDQSRMAQEIRRVARGYFVQTPNVCFPVEPHFLVPGWQLAPVSLRTWLLQRRDLGWMKRVEDRREARAVVESIHLLNVNKLRQLFPDGRIYREKICLFTKSITAWRPI
jgi:hypothetical protein